MAVTSQAVQAKNDLRIGDKIFTFLKYFLLILFSAIALIPVSVCVLTAFKTTDEYNATNVLTPPENWLKKNVIRFAPLKTRDFYIYGSHESAAPRTTKHKLRIYAATAFGSGRHQTTRLCLRLVSRLFHRGFSPTGILDMGCGSGILALASLRLWPAARAVAADIDPEAVIVTLQNAADNNLDERINAADGDGFDNPAIDKESPFELILANILARPLTEMAPQMAKHLRPGGHVVLSGFTAEQTDWVVNTYKNAGFTLAAVVKNQNWRAVLMEKTK